MVACIARTSCMIKIPCPDGIAIGGKKTSYNQEHNNLFKISEHIKLLCHMFVDIVKFLHRSSISIGEIIEFFFF